MRFLEDLDEDLVTTLSSKNFICRRQANKSKEMKSFSQSALSPRMFAVLLFTVTVKMKAS